MSTRSEFKIHTHAAGKPKRTYRKKPMAPVITVDVSAAVDYAKSVVADPTNGYTRWEITPDYKVVIR